MSKVEAVAAIDGAIGSPEPSPAWNERWVTGSGSNRKATGLTIAIPNWNHRGFLPRSIRSARAAIASIREFGYPGEVLVIDDASRDGSGSFLRSLDGMYGWDDVSVLLQAKNAGLAAVRNRALELTRFSHVLFLD